MFRQVFFALSIESAHIYPLIRFVDPSFYRFFTVRIAPARAVLWKLEFEWRSHAVNFLARNVILD